jgi:hypothetical protein
MILGASHPEFTKPTKKPFELPYWCLYIAWFLSFAAVSLSAFFTILYSFEWGGVKSKAWLQSIFLSFFTSEGLINPLKVIRGVRLRVEGGGKSIFPMALR